MNTKEDIWNSTKMFDVQDLKEQAITQWYLFKPIKNPIRTKEMGAFAKVMLSKAVKMNISLINYPLNVYFDCPICLNDFLEAQKNCKQLLFG